MQSMINARFPTSVRIELAFMGFMDGFVAGWLDGWLDGQMDGLKGFNQTGWPRKRLSLASGAQEPKRPPATTPP